MWLAVALSKRDGELSCDAGAVKALGDEGRIPYGRTLVSLVAQRSLRPEDLLSCSTSMVEGKGSIQERIAQLVKHPKAKKTALAAAVSCWPWRRRSLPAQWCSAACSPGWWW